ncbi:MAG: hypothetical protein OEW68_15945 [Gammaproteobacteria bacterium]|nr:hypothetical protein [Gammaproteobacteria bacterium]MDH4316317.1 hypothetical protein [Gammaproteobacteria bacterium]MDH5215992.1 hypothetical protein [Gammaproteobacteria bacterium]
MESALELDVLRVADVPPGNLQELLARFDLNLHISAPGAAIEGSYWGEPEAGLVGHTVHVRPDTPIHSLLHEACHSICMSAERRESLHRDAGGDDLEESAVCFLQIVLADSLAGVGSSRLMQDMDAWGYSFRLGNTASWFAGDAADAQAWLVAAGLLAPDGKPRWVLRQS